MKNNVWKIIKIILVLAVGAGFCFALYYLIDEKLNGFFFDWFENTFLYSDGYFNPYDNVYYNYWHLRRSKLKLLLLSVFVIGTLFWLVVAMVSSYIHGRRMTKKSITEISRMIQSYMTSEKDDVGIFPSEYSEISAQMLEIKSEINHKEQILKDEAARKNDMIAYLAHDLKTPLASVIGYLSLLDEAPDMPAEQRAKYVRISLDKALRLEKLINEFFEITRYNLQKINLEKENIDLSYMLVQMSDEFYPIMKEHGNTAVLHIDDNLMIYADSVKLARVFNNILKNAIAYSYPNTEIIITAEHREQGVRIVFQNKGRTIPKQKLESVFEKFFRLDEARTSNTGGAGLGLAIAKEIVTLHGGSITAESENESTAFTVDLPLQD